MKNKFAELLKVKSIVTLILCGVFAYLSIIGEISGRDFMTVFTTVIAFYFGTKHEQNNDKLKG